MDKPAEAAGEAVRTPTLILLRVYALILGSIGLTMLSGGIWLGSLGGSFYYAVAGLIITASAVLLFLRRSAGAWLYGLVLALTLGWAVYEVGVDGWALMPRIVLPLALGVWLLLPWTQRALKGHSIGMTRRVHPAALILGGAVASLVLGFVLHVAFVAPTLALDPRFQTGETTFLERTPVAVPAAGSSDDWARFGGDDGGSRYTRLDQIKPGNVATLKVAWSVDVGSVPGMTATPIKIGNTLYTCNNRNEVFAIDAATGKQRWTYDASNGYGGVCRGVSYYRVPGAAGLCGTRIFTATNTAQLIAIDAESGQACPDFGKRGIVDLLVGMADADGKTVGGYYRVRAAPTIVRGKIVLGGFVTDNQYWGEPSGVIRAFDAVTGKLAWAWDVGHPDRTGEPPAGESYTPSTPNSWAPMSVDEELGLVYAPTGNATPDLFGGNRRPFDDKYSSSVVALDAETGRTVWSFQTRHHDLWDHDVASQPTLVELPDAGGRIRKALIQPTKQGEIFVLDRASGKPIFDVVEKPVPQSGAVREERLSPTQPYSDRLPSFRGADLREADMWGLSPIDQLYCRIRFKQARYEGPHTPPGLTPSLIYPSMFGAINWGSISVDPVHRVMVVNSNRMASYVRLLPRKEVEDRKLIREGEFADGMKQAFGSPQENTPYGVERPYWLTALGVPCIAPPYGLLSAVDLDTGKLVWTQRFGTALGSGPPGFDFPLALPMGTPNHGGSLITSSGLLFIGATPDNFLHAYDLPSGKLLWRTELPGGGNSLPISYAIGGRQYIAISAGGSGVIGARQSTKMVAFILP